MKKTLIAMVICLLVGGCATIQEWYDNIPSEVKEQVAEVAKAAGKVAATNLINNLEIKGELTKEQADKLRELVNSQ
jgi:uncharacterized protein YceK